MSDAQLLREYAEQGVEDAFAEIVARHTNLVYSAALRQVDAPDIAADVAQSVFIGLVRRARSLAPQLAQDASLAGWLCRSARNISLNLRRDEFRRHSRERLAMENLDPSSTTSPDWERLRPVLDEAMSELDEPDYDALVLRFFKNQDLRAVGVALGVSDDAAQKRVSRTLDKLREHLARRGITTSAAALSFVLSMNAVRAAPSGLSKAIVTHAALAGTTKVTSATAIAAKAIAMTTKAKAALLLAALLLFGVATLVVTKKESIQPTSATGAVVDLNDYLGQFQMVGHTLFIRKQGTGIAVGGTDGGAPFIAYPQSADEFVSHDQGSLTKLTFARDASRRVSQLTLVRDGRLLGQLKRQDNP